MDMFSQSLAWMVLAAGSGVPVDQIVQMVKALLEHLMTSSPNASDEHPATGRPGRPQPRRKRRIAASEGAAGAADADATVPQVNELPTHVPVFAAGSSGW
jgi:hypothetical protein